MIKQELEWPAFDEVEFDANMDGIPVGEQIAKTPVCLEAIKPLQQEEEKCVNCDNVFHSDLLGKDPIFRRKFFFIKFILSLSDERNYIFTFRKK